MGQRYLVLLPLNRELELPLSRISVPLLLAKELSESELFMEVSISMEAKGKINKYKFTFESLSMAFKFLLSYS